MSLDYRLTLAGSTPVEQVAERALPDFDERPVGTAPLLSVNLADRYGFDVSVRAGRSGYVDALSDDGQWEWEPDEYVNVSFHVDKVTDMEQVAINLLTVVRRVLNTGPEDATLVLNGDILLLARFQGVLVKHNREKWWSHYPAAEQLIPG
jgi:hypothetical protein